MDSKVRSQFELLPRNEAHHEPVTPSLIQRIRRLPTFNHAWNYAHQVSALEDKEVYGELEIDGSHYTKIKKGNASPPSDERFDKFLDVVENEIPLIWWVEKRGYDWLSLRKHRNDVERRLAEVEQENADLKRAFALAFGQKQR